MRVLPLSEAILKYLVPWTEYDWPLDWEAVFGRKGPLVVEVGFGNGGFLEEIAVRRPEVNFLGIERSWRTVHRLFKRLDRAGLSNVHVAQGSADFLLERLFVPGSVEKIYINFSDPWPKERHHGRRLIQPAFMNMLAQRLTPGGEVTIATDHAEYAAWIGEVLEGQDLLVSCFETTVADHLPDRNPTKYEQKALDAGVEIHYFVWRRAGEVSAPVLVEKVEEMPNVIMRGTFDPACLLADFEPLSWQMEHRGVSVVVRLVSLYRDTQGDYLVEAMVKEDTFSQHFGVLVLARPGERLLVKLSPIGHPRPTWGVKQAVGKVAALVQGQCPDLKVEESTVGR